MCLITFKFCDPMDTSEYLPDPGMEPISLGSPELVGGFFFFFITAPPRELISFISAAKLNSSLHKGILT